MAKSEGEVNRSAAIRSAVEKLGIDTPGPDIKAEVLKNHPTLATFCASSTFSNYVSVIKKRIRETQSPTAAVKPKKAVPAPTSNGTTSLVSMLESLKGLVDAHGKDDLKRIIDIL